MCFWCASRAAVEPDFSDRYWFFSACVAAAVSLVGGTAGEHVGGCAVAAVCGARLCPAAWLLTGWRWHAYTASTQMRRLSRLNTVIPCFWWSRVEVQLSVLVVSPSQNRQRLHRSNSARNARVATRKNLLASGRAMAAQNADNADVKHSMEDPVAAWNDLVQACSWGPASWQPSSSAQRQRAPTLPARQQLRPHACPCC
jgi:hypothetical protein